MDQNIEIAIRIKPCSSSVLSPICGWDSSSIQVTDRNIFTFDSVIDPDAHQDFVFDKVGMRIISNILDGYNGCIFAYGQTGSGKTFTMTGYHNNQGLVQKCLRKLWNCVRSSQFFEIKLGYFEIYNETIKDLLSNQENLAIREHAKTGFYIENLTEKIVQKYEDFQELLNQGISARTIKETKMNSTSSRSHSVLDVTMTYKKRQNSLIVLKHAKLTFIDLAGSEKQKQTQVEGQRLKEAANINKSLSTLSLVISKLSEQSQRKSGSNQMQVHIPFRNSVLTKILKNSLTGKSKITIICTVSLEQRFIDETISTLRFAQMAKSIKMKVNKNEEQFDGSKQRLFEEFASVKQRMSEFEESNKQLSRQNEELKRENACLKDEIEQKETELNQLQISMECMKIESKQIFQEIKTSAQVPSQFAMTQSRPFYHSDSQVPQNYNEYRSSQARMSQFRGQNNNFPSNQISQNIFNPHLQSQFSSQLSFFKSHISQDANSQRNSFFTIQEADSKAQNSGEDSKEKVQERIKELQIELEKFKVENEFLKFYREIQEFQIAELIKYSVFLKAKQDEIEEANKLFGELVRNQQFSHAQLKFLDACLKNSQKDKMTLNLVSQEKKIQKAKFNQTTEKIKNLLLSYIEKRKTFQLQEQLIHQDFVNLRGSEFFGSPQKRSATQSHSFLQNFHEKSDNFFTDGNETFGTINQWCKEEKKQPKSFQKKKSMQVEESIEMRASQTPPVNIRQNVSQIPFFYPQQTQGFNSGFFQSSQVPMFMLDSRSLRSQTTNKLSSNELEYLKKDYEKMVRDVREMKEEIQKNKVLMMEKDGLLDEKSIEVEEMKDKIRALEEQIETQKKILEVEKNISKEKLSKKVENDSNNRETIKMLLEKEQELQHLKQFQSQTESNHQSQTNMLKLRIKELQLTITNMNSSKVQLLNDKSNILQEYELKFEEINKELTNVRKEKEQISIEYGVINSENAILTERYNYLKSCLKNNQISQADTPKKLYSKRSSFYSVSQQSSPVIEINRPQTLNFPTKPKELSEQQCIEVIENKTLQSMYQAAYYFYKKSFAVEYSKRTFEERIITLQEEINQLVQKHQKVLQKMDHELVDAKRSALSRQEAVIDLKKEILDLKKQIYDQQKLIDDLCSNEKRVKQYSQLLQTKLKQKNQRQLEAKQKAHNLSAQLRDNSLTPNYLENNKKLFFGKNRYTSGSQDSLVSNGDTPIILVDVNGSGSRRLTSGERNSVEEVRRQFVNNDELQDLRNQIMEAQYDAGSDCYNKVEGQNNCQKTQSVASHTLTNANLTQENPTQENLPSVNMFQSNQNRSKAATTKGHFTFNIFNRSNQSKK